LMGFITVGYMANRFTEAFVQGYFQEGLRRRQERKMIEKLHQHYILCGYGRTGRQIAQEFQTEGIPFVILETDPEQIEKAKSRGYIVLSGDATLDETLLSAKIQSAICIVTSLSSDAENLYTVLSAKTLNPKIRPFYLEEFQIDQLHCPFIGQTLRAANLRGQSGALVLAIRRLDRTLIVGPTGETLLWEGDALICLGTADQLRLLNQLLSPLSSSGRKPPNLPKEIR